MENRYDKYKDSGIAWIGEIPEHWEIKKGKNLFKKEERPVRDNDEIITCFRDGEVTLRSKRRTDGFTNAMKEVGYQGVRKGDLVIHNMDAFAGAIGVSDSDGKSTPVYSVCTPKNNVEVDVYYYAYLLRSYALGGVIQSLAKGIRERSTDFRYKEFGDLFYQKPPIQEQQSIATYLDQKCGEIDELITLQEEMITKLQSYKQSVITEAVTKGWDKNVPLKDSGIEWIGKIPEHWKIVCLKRLSRISTGNQDTQDSTPDGKYPFFVRSPKVERSNRYTFEGPSILMAGDGVGAGKVFHLADNKFACHQRVYCISQFSKINRIFLFYYLSSLFYNIIDSANSKSTVDSVRLPMLAEFPVCIPSDLEQQSIADYLDRKCSEIDELISIKQQKIEKLKDYKKSLIFECVTGKRKV